MQEIKKNNKRLQNKTKHVGGVMCESIPSIDDMQFDEEGRPTSFRNY